MSCDYPILFSLGRLLALALCVSIATIYVSKSPMLETVRRNVDRRNRQVGFALKCVFCVEGWSSCAFALLYRPFFLQFLFDDTWYVGGINLFAAPNFIVSWFTLWGLATLSYRHLWPFLEKHAPKMRMLWNGGRV